MANSDLDLPSPMQGMLVEMAAMRAELNELKTRTNINTDPESTLSVKPVVSTSRRKALRRLAGGLVAGAGMIGGAAALPGTAQAKLTARAGRIGAIATPTGASTSNDLTTGTNQYGLLAFSGTGNIDLSNNPALPANNVAIFAYCNIDFGFGVQGASNGANGIGVYGTGVTGVDGVGVFQGVAGFSDVGAGVVASTNTGIPFRIVSGSQPSSGTRVTGDMYVDASGNLHIWNGSAWRVVTTTAG